MNCSNITAIVAVIVSVATLIVTFRQLGLFRYSHGIDLIFNLENKFDAPRMRFARHLFAEAHLRKDKSDEIEEILDFFEVLGLLVRKKAVDQDVVWNSFSHWILRYGNLADTFIKSRRIKESDNTYYEEFEGLVSIMKKIDCKKRFLKSFDGFTEKQINDFLSEEKDLTKQEELAKS
jgi:hypothetical protein